MGHVRGFLGKTGVVGMAVAMLSGCAVDGMDARETQNEETVGDSDDELGVVSSGAIIGTNDLVSVVENGANIAERYRPVINAVGRISMGCTGTHVGDGIVVTAGHCFDAPSQRVNNRPCSQTIIWGWRKDRNPYMRSTCTRILAMEQNWAKDYAIFKVDPVPPVKVAVRLDERVADRTPSTIFSHPRSRPLEWSGACELRTASDTVHQLYHRCDTEGGSSGAAVIDDATTEILAIHGGFFSGWNYSTALMSTPLAEFL